MAACLLAGCFFLFRGLPSSPGPNEPPASGTLVSAAEESQYVTANIEDVRVGEWVLAHNPELSEGERQAVTAVDPATWRTIGLRMEKADGGRLDIVLLRPLESLEDCGATLGATVHLELAELGAEGPAEVLSIEPCPSIGPPSSAGCQVVTGTFAHSSGEILDLSIDGLDAPIGVTANHPFWSEDRQEFIPAGELHEGETLRTATDGSTHVTAITPRQITEPVYNLEVDVEHVYYVSSTGVLVHNTYGGRYRSPKLPKGITRVSRWGRSGLKPGDWVMKGKMGWWKYIFSGKWQPKWIPGKNMPAKMQTGQEFVVPKSSLVRPKGFLGKLKSLLGQRHYVPDRPNLPDPPD